MTTTTITIPVDEVLEALGHGDNWAQGAWKNVDGKMCLHGGIRQCQKVPGDAYLIEHVGATHGWGTEWNDEDGRVWPDIETTLQAHREVLPAELEATFGPQWEHIVALVRRVAVLTTDEVRQLVAAWIAAVEALWGAPEDASWIAAVEALRGAPEDASWNASRNAVAAALWGASGAAAWDAAVEALWGASVVCLRDLIGQHGFTQEHYDALTKPWATVIGPAHPDDKPVSA
jgi:hypothetical protein